MHLVVLFRAGIIDLSNDSLTIEITGGNEKIDGLLEVLRPYGVLEMARTGRVAMARGARNGAPLSAEVQRGPSETGDATISYSV